MNIVLVTELIKFASKNLWCSVVFIEIVKIEVDEWVLEKPRWSCWEGIVYSVFMFQANGFQVRLNTDT